MPTKKKITIVVEGEPMGKQRPRVAVLGNSKFAHAYTPKETIQYESKVVHNYKLALEKLDLDSSTPFFDHNTEIWCSITAYFPITKGHYKFHKKTGTVDLDKDGIAMKEGLINPMKKPDCDNIAKICLDALNGIAYPDDSQITCVFIMKHYSEEPRVEILLESRFGNDGTE